MKQIIIYGAGNLGKKAYEEYGGNNVLLFIDKNKAGTELFGKKVLSFDDYRTGKYEEEILLCVAEFVSVVKLFIDNGVSNFSIYHKVYERDDVPLSHDIAHGKWQDKLIELADFDGSEVLEIGSRVVTGANFRNLFQKANYTGFDLYEGENVDIAGDAHRLSKYFDKKFDLIFSSAVFEHFAMPWVVADEITKLLKVGGYVFVETHYSYNSHERPWHFFQFSEQALKVLFSEKRGFECIEAGCSNPLISVFSEKSCAYLRGRAIAGMYVHSEFLGKKVSEMEDLSWENNLNIKSLGMYPDRENRTEGEPE